MNFPNQFVSQTLAVFRDEMPVRLSTCGLVLSGSAVGVVAPAIMSSLPQGLFGSTLTWMLLAMTGVAFSGHSTVDAFAGDRESGTLESLLATSLSLKAMVVGKIIATCFLAIGSSVLMVATKTILSGLRFGWHIEKAPSLWTLTCIAFALITLTLCLCQLAIIASIFQPSAQAARLTIFGPLTIVFIVITGLTFTGALSEFAERDWQVMTASTGTGLLVLNALLAPLLGKLLNRESLLGRGATMEPA